MKNLTGLFRSTLGALALATLLVAPLGCAEIDENGEAIAESAEALSSPLIATPEAVSFGTVARGSATTFAVTLTNTGSTRLSGITVSVPPDPYNPAVPPDPYNPAVPPDPYNPAVPPDPYRIAHSPMEELGAGASSHDLVLYFAPTMEGTFPRSLVVTYQVQSSSGVATGATLTIPVTGTAK